MDKSKLIQVTGRKTRFSIPKTRPVEVERIEMCKDVGDQRSRSRMVQKSRKTNEEFSETAVCEI
jgi:hypothetical protein